MELNPTKQHNDISFSRAITVTLPEDLHPCIQSNINQLLCSREEFCMMQGLKGNECGEPFHYSSGHHFKWLIPSRAWIHVCTPAHLENCWQQNCSQILLPKLKLCEIEMYMFLRADFNDKHENQSGPQWVCSISGLE